ncbi:hypothetical protein [Streptomyces fungicidicus]|uniref:hypothetical protein n=1 Tax=Streptomyces fungicidicus TaxID=68203 RepID=UPI0037F82CC9
MRAVGEGIVTADGDRAAAPCHSSLMDGCRSTLADLDAVIFHRDFHPAGHYWPLQPAGTGILLLVAALSALAVTVAALATAAASAPLNRRTA